MKNCCHNYTLESLSFFHTKQLLNMLDSLRSCYMNEWNRYYMSPNCDECLDIKHRNEMTILLKKELSNRPHIKNKKESKEYRKRLIKQGV